MPDPMDSLLLVLGVLIVGIIAITFWIAWMIFKARYKKQHSTANAAAATTPPFSIVPRDVFLLALDRAPDGAWEIAVNGKHYPTLEAVPDDAVRQDVVAGLKELAAFARSYVQKDRALKQPPAPAATPPLEPAARVVAPVAPDNQAPPVRKPVAPVAPPAGPQIAPVPTDRLRVFLKGEPSLKRSDAAPAIMPALDLAREIGEIVEEMQARIPSLAQRSIKLQDAPSGGVCFAVDGIVYATVDEIPDADVQALIRAATKEWERR